MSFGADRGTRGSRRGAGACTVNRGLWWRVQEDKRGGGRIGADVVGGDVVGSGQWLFSFRVAQHQRS
eukprot:3064779-Prorocentrum_lima.AAC.1